MYIDEKKFFILISKQIFHLNNSNFNLDVYNSTLYCSNLDVYGYSEVSSACCRVKRHWLY